MNTRSFNLLTTVAVLFITSFLCPTASAKLINAVPVAGVFNLTATHQDVKINGQTVHAMIYADNNNALPLVGGVYQDGIPILVMNLNVGDTVICKFTNKLPVSEVAEGASIHWHGVELDN